MNPQATMTPYIVERTSQGERLMDIWSRLLRERIVYLGTAIDDFIGNTAAAQLLFLDAEGDDPISLYINSPGGLITAGLAIYDVMQYIKAPVHTICVGQASSMAAWLLAAGAKGSRYALPNAKIMIHQPIGGTQGQASDVEIQAREMLKIKQRMCEILARHTGKPIDQVSKDVDRDYYLDPQEAIQYGIIDAILPNRKTQ